ncbi:MAG: HAD hydrolase-like protein [Weeksellaceae bacterium]
MTNTIIFDWKRTLYDPDLDSLIDGATELLSFLKEKNYRLVLIGKGDRLMFDAVKRLQVESYFLEIIFNASKSETQFTKFISQDKPQDTIIIGDRVLSELSIGKKLGTTTIWIKQGKFADEKPNNNQNPDYVVTSLHECLDLFETTLLSI